MRTIMASATLTVLLMTTGISAFAQERIGTQRCEITEITPPDADFFTGGFRYLPVVGDAFVADFDGASITSIVFENGGVFFAEGSGLLTKLNRGFPAPGFGGLRQGNHGLYIGLLSAPVLEEEGGSSLTSHLTVTSAHWDTQTLTAHATHHAKLSCSSTVKQ